MAAGLGLIGAAVGWTLYRKRKARCFIACCARLQDAFGTTSFVLHDVAMIGGVFVRALSAVSAGFFVLVQRFGLHSLSLCLPQLLIG